MSKIRAIIVDDEDKARHTLRVLIQDFCDGVEVIADCSNVLEAVDQIRKLQADVVFLDIEMPVHSGFKLFDFIPNPEFDVVFVTAYDQFALRAFDISAADYLLKPVDISKLQRAIDKVKIKQLYNRSHQLDWIKNTVLKQEITKISLPMIDGIVFLDVPDIIYLEANGAYTSFHTLNSETHLVSKRLKIYEDFLEPHPDFFRIHRSYLIHLTHVGKYHKGQNMVLMNNGVQIPVARERKQDFENLLRNRRLL